MSAVSTAGVAAVAGAAPLMQSTGAGGLGPVGGIAGSASGIAGLGSGVAGSGSGGNPDAGALTFSSSAVPTNGAFPDANTCVGADTSPDLEWAFGRSQPQSYAVMLADAGSSAVQWVVWDIPATVTALPAALPPSAMLAMPAGAKQTSTQGSGYVGPCPQGEQRFYEFTIFALSVTTLPGVTTLSTPEDVATALNLSAPLELAFFGASAGTNPSGDSP
jgi:Raf kinase inhibitor-like YbhB/YbcL family protein